MKKTFYIALTLFLFSSLFTGSAQVYQLFGTKESPPSDKKATFQLFGNNDSSTEITEIDRRDDSTLRADGDDWYVGLPCPQCSIGKLDEDGKCDNPDCDYVLNPDENAIGAVDPLPIGDGLELLLCLALLKILFTFVPALPNLWREKSGS